MTTNKLGEFIRSHRERVSPQSAGLPGGGRRRTPGLRREELAQLCEISPTWLTWLEQGRQVAASAQMLARLADVLQLSGAERAYLFSLAERLDPQRAMHGAHGGQEDGTARELDAIVQAVQAPAYVLDLQWDAAAWNADAAALFAGWLDGGADQHGRPPNLLRFMFCQRAARNLIVDWPHRAQRLVAEFRADTAQHAGQEPLASLIAELARDSCEFRELWNLQDVLGREGGVRRFQHPARGALGYQQVTLHLARRQDLKLTMLLPMPEPHGAQDAVQHAAH
ncbi:helix-turn-helix transcriptional regulator [Massilia sp. Root351]|uniref:helix-turn-helix transcriptional regulator n=1 Tax=Massilia sp. Root351 TaxID=1736522 RepID=UPI0035A32C8D